VQKGEGGKKMSAWTIYWILKLDAICETLQVIGTLSLVCLATYVLVVVITMIMDNTDDTSPVSYLVKTLKEVAIIGVVSFIVVISGTLLPSTNQMVTIIVAPKIINNKQVQQIPQKLLDLGEYQVDKWIKQLKENNNEQGK
jgi:hypothetical protein